MAHFASSTKKKIIKIEIEIEINLKCIKGLDDIQIKFNEKSICLNLISNKS